MSFLCHNTMLSKSHSKNILLSSDIIYLDRVIKEWGLSNIRHALRLFIPSTFLFPSQRGLLYSLRVIRQRQIGDRTVAISFYFYETF